MMAAIATTCVLDNLSEIEQSKLQQAWVHLLRLSGVEGLKDEGVTASTPDRTQAFQKELDDKSPDSFRKGLWTGIMAEHPDAIILRFLKARKWDVELAVTMLVSAINWRGQQKMNDNIIRTGEACGLQETQSADDKGFMMQYRSGKSYVRGSDKEGRPIYIIRVRLHDPNMQSPDAMEAYTLHNIESIRNMVTYPQDKACLLFDMTNFGLKNMDFHVVKYLCQVFEARYPETLGVVLIHNAPFVFWGIWRVIKPWLDPVIASKINFTRSTADLQAFIAKDNLQKEHGGTDTWEYKYIEPVATENDRMDESEKRSKVEEERHDLTREFEQATIDWISHEAGSPAAKEKQDIRESVKSQLCQNYWALDPFIRSRNYYHRAGVMNEKGEADFKGAGHDKQPVNGAL